jgi:hypothetical protein
VSSESVVAVEHLGEAHVKLITLEELAAIKIFGDVKDFNIGVLNLTPEIGVEGVEVHGFGGELVQCRGCEGRRAPRVCRFTDWSGHPAR